MGESYAGLNLTATFVAISSASPRTQGRSSLANFPVNVFYRRSWRWNSRGCFFGFRVDSTFAGDARRSDT